MKRLMSNKGFTMTELVVAMMITSMIMGGVYSTFYSQQKSFITQDQLCMMQQNLRAAMYFLEREIRMAGYDPTGGAAAGIQNLGWDGTENRYTSIGFTSDTTDNTGTGAPDGDTGDANENIIYALYDPDLDGHNDLGRNDVNGAGNELLAENIDALDLVYLNEDGVPTTSTSEIRSVQISLVARSDRPDPGYHDTTVYKNQQGTTIYTPTGVDSSYRRKMLTAEVKCRNLGMD